MNVTVVVKPANQIPVAARIGTNRIRTAAPIPPSPVTILKTKNEKSEGAPQKHDSA